MNNKQLLLIFSLIALILLSFTACTEPVGNETGDASFTITINGGTSRSVLNWDNSGDVYKITDLDHTIILSNGIVPDKMQENLRTGDNANFTVTPGNWNITVWAYLKNVPKAYSSQNVVLKPGNNGIINMKMGAPPSGGTPITVAEITITAPVNGGTPATTVSSTSERFTAGTVTWEPNDNPFNPSTEYTASVTLTAKSGFTFIGLNAANAKVNNSIASISNNTGETVTLSHKFPATGTKIVTSIAINSPPNKMTYTHGDKLDLSGMVVKLTYNEGSPQDVAAENFAAYGITPTPAQGTHLERSKYNGNSIKIEYGTLTTNTNNTLTVNAKSLSDTDITVEPSSITAVIYTGSPITPPITVKHSVEGSERTLTKDIDYTVAYSDNTSAGTATITITGKDDYKDTRTISFTISKAQGAAVSGEPTLNKISPLTINAVTVSNNQSIEYGISTTNKAETVTAWQEELIFYSSINNDLKEGYVNYIFARSKGDNNHNPGPPSTSLSVGVPIKFPISQTNTGNPGLEEWLNKQPLNTTETPYIIRAEISYDNKISGSLGGSLKRYPTKYVIIDFIASSGYNLTSISDQAFSYCISLVSVTIPDGVNIIGGYAFNGCTSLTSVTIPDSVTSIGEAAFFDCTNLTSITIPSRVTTIGDYAFYGCTSLTAINVDAGNSAYSSQDGVLYNRNKTTLFVYPAKKTGSTFTIPNSVTSIGDGFNDCINLTSITIPSSVNSIETWVFYGCTNLTTINVDSSNNTYSSQDGVLYNKNKTTLVVYPAGKTGNITIPESVTTIGVNAFSTCNNIVNIFIPNNVTSIGDSAFSDCTNLASITIPGSVTKIGDYAFYNCTSLTSVTFAAGSNISNNYFGEGAFPEGSVGYGNTLKNAYLAASSKEGTYTRAANGLTWEKQ